MLVIGEYKMMWRPILKVGSTSMYNFFSEKLFGKEYVKSHEHDQCRDRINDSYWEQPHRIKILREMVGEDLNGFFKFAFIRNPWHRLASAHNTLMRRDPFGDRRPFDARWGLSFARIYEIMKGDRSFEAFVDFVKYKERDHTEYVNGHWRSQVGLLQLGGVLKMKYDFIGRLENIQEDFPYVLNKLNLPEEHLYKNNVSPKYNWREYYNTKLIDQVGEYYTRDIEEFDFRYE